MYSWNYDSNAIVEQLGGQVLGKPAVVIKHSVPISSACDNTLMFASTKKWNRGLLTKIEDVQNSAIIVEPDILEDFKGLTENNQIIVTNNARLYFAKALKLIIDSINVQRQYSYNDGFIVIGENVKIGNNVKLEPFVFIDHDVVIGDNVVIKTGAKIRSNVQISDDVIIGENCVIGGQGFGVETDTDGKHVRIPHIGGVMIGKASQIGSLSSVLSGTMNPTIIEDNCFIDEMVHIAHNCKVGQGCVITSLVELSGSASLGENCYLAPNCTIRNSVSLGNNCFVGQASSVQKTFGDNVNLVGNPAREFKK